MATFQYNIATGTDDAFSSGAAVFNNSYSWLGFGTEPGKPPQETMNFYVRFAINLSPDVTICEAKITFTCQQSSVASTHNYNAQIVNLQNAGPLTARPTDLTGTPVVCTIPDISTEDTWQTPDVKSLLQTWISGIGGDTYSPGDHIVFCFLHQTSDAFAIEKWYSYEGNPSKAAVLDVTFTDEIASYHRTSGSVSLHSSTANVQIAGNANAQVAIHDGRATIT